MKKRFVDPFCPCCHGRGDVMEEEMYEGEPYYITNDCYCVEWMTQEEFNQKMESEGHVL
jgi:hypothetical protein